MEVQHVITELDHAYIKHFLTPYRFPVFFRRLYFDYWRQDAFQAPADKTGFYMHIDIPSDIANDDDALSDYIDHLTNSFFGTLQHRYRLTMPGSPEFGVYPPVQYFYFQVRDEAPDSSAHPEGLLEVARYWLIWLVHISTATCNHDSDELFSQPGSLTVVEPPQDSKSHT